MASTIPSNRATFTRAELLDATGGECPAFKGPVTGVSTDSRSDLRGAAFVALRGERFDGHAFVGAAVKAGARVVIVEEPVQDSGEAVVLRVPSTERALGALARYHRRRWGGKVVAVAGSVGKTTTRSSTAAVLAGAGQAVHCPLGNLNNLIGVPLVLLGLEREHSVAVVELGTSLPGEVARLAAMSEPDVAVLTRIALEHAAGLGDLDAIEAEEGALLAALGRGRTAIVNGDDERCVRQLAASAVEHRRLYGTGSLHAQRLDYRLRVEGVSVDGTRVHIERTSGGELAALSPLIGLPGAYALTAAVAATEALLGRRLDREELARALTSPALGEPGRLTPRELADGSLVLDDTYNSSPASVQSSIRVARELADARGARLLLALGEMRELGALSAAAHRDLGAPIVASRPAFVVAFGGDARAFLEEPARAGLPTAFAEDAALALEQVERARQPGDVILVKASRSLRGERIVDGLWARAGERAAKGSGP